MQDPSTSAPGSELGPAGDAHRRAFAVADELAVHGSRCVCPRCAAALPGLLARLARAVDDVDRAAVD